MKPSSKPNPNTAPAASKKTTATASPAEKKNKTTKASPALAPARATKTSETKQIKVKVVKVKSTEKKPKLVHDRYSLPKDEDAALGALKRRVAVLGFKVKKNTLLRAGLLTLGKLADTALLDALRALPEPLSAASTDKPSKPAKPTKSAKAPKDASPKKPGKAKSPAGQAAAAQAAGDGDATQAP
ncbi:hypothetical protein ACLBKS_06175 [Hylemonella sp. W303a]|uniref:hypothetical protein n=1 Tax=Hylemonella sp. W303a TaxID=3389873 RepID=UPI00396B2BEB